MENNETQEEQTTQELKEEVTPKGEPTVDTGDRKPVDEPTENIVSRAEKAEKGINELMPRLEENIGRLEKLKAQDILGGRSIKSQTPEETKEMSEEEYADALIAGKIKCKDE